MKTKMTYAAIFGAAFVIVTILIIFVNGMFQNIFKFDFSPAGATHVEQIVDNNSPVEEDTQATEPENDTKVEEKSPSVANYAVNNTNTVDARLDSTLVDSLNIFRKKLAELEKRNQILMEQKQNLEKADTVKTPTKNLKLEEWATQTAKLYESMDPKKAAKIIQNYSDNESREILFKMNKKKAAKILAELKPDVAQRITRAL